MSVKIRIRVLEDPAFGRVRGNANSKEKRSSPALISIAAIRSPENARLCEENHPTSGQETQKAAIKKDTHRALNRLNTRARA